MLILGIDTSGKTASCALCTENAVLAQNTFVTKLTHSQVIMPMCKKMLSDAGKNLSDVEGFAAISGPGSYTGLRIGIAAVKGLCFGLDKKCAGVSSLMSLAYNFKGISPLDGIICPVMHARQELVYNALFKADKGNIIREREDSITPVNLLADELSSRTQNIILTGDYAETLYDMLKDKCSHITLASPPLRAPLASSLCYAAMDMGFSSPDDLNAEYLQITKAEKDLNEAKQPQKQ
ncbi:MAG: tRNA (adenosine(37)-N6)-threonylcarbamoyltransferase complex dimerization subunit type 1 TsaB [Huintestinicola sp.]|uniref:tRNA (adenosine(37)-N6)-threonylcarbamoyltransferase complex dimerization subunit type 1 TsaB n=1 Tax=Huintestinicola sp. TaxID=2981661 RepID=UPI003EFFA1C4